MTEGPFLHYGTIRLLNLPHAKAVADEVLVEDCYRKEEVPHGAIVLDVGGFYGEFGIWCSVERACQVTIYEPSLVYEVAWTNQALNSAHVEVRNCAIGGRTGLRLFRFRPEHPAGSALSDNEGDPTPTVSLSEEVKRFRNFKVIVVKLDCEGAEREIFEDESWLKDVYIVTMEWHNKDGHHYKEILERHGFDVSLDQIDPEVVRGMLFAKRKT
jgi:FkbM family methyltransferase